MRPWDALLLRLEEIPEYTAVCSLAHKEEIGSMGITGMQSQAFEYFMECLCRGQNVSLMDCFAHSECLSADVTNSQYDPTYGETCDKRNNSRINGGVCFMKYTGARGKSGSSDVSGGVRGKDSPALRRGRRHLADG